MVFGESLCEALLGVPSLLGVVALLWVTLGDDLGVDLGVVFPDPFDSSFAAFFALRFDSFFSVSFFLDLGAGSWGIGVSGIFLLNCSKENVIPLALAHCSFGGGTGAFPAPQTD